MQPPSNKKIYSFQDAIERCQSLGMRLSRQRRYILELLWDVREHLSAREIYDQLNQQGKKIGHTSVYQNLEALFEQGIIECIERSDGRLYGHLNSSQSYVNSLDTQKIIDIDVKLPSAVIQEVEQRTGLKITDYRIDFFGTVSEDSKISVSSSSDTDKVLSKGENVKIDARTELPESVIQEVEARTGVTITDYRVDFFSTVSEDSKTPISSDVDPDKTILKVEDYEQGIALSRYETSPERWAELQYGLAQAYIQQRSSERLNDVDLAIKALQQSLTVYTHASFPEKWREILIHLGRLFFKRIQLTYADKTFEISNIQQLSLLSENKDFSERTLDFFFNLGQAYIENEAKAHRQAHSYFLEAIKVCQKLFFTHFNASLLVSKSKLSFDFSQQIDFLRQALNIYSELKDKKNEGYVLEEIGWTHHLYAEDEGLESEAVEFYADAQGKYHEVKDYYREAKLLLRWSEIYAAERLTTETLELLEEATSVALLINIPSQKDQCLYDISEALIVFSGLELALENINTLTELGDKISLLEKIIEMVPSVYDGISDEQQERTDFLKDIFSRISEISPENYRDLMTSFDKMKSSDSRVREIFTVLEQLKLLPSQRISSYEVFLRLDQDSQSISIGSTIALSVSLRLLSETDQAVVSGAVFDVLHSEVFDKDLNLFLVAPGFQVQGASVASLPLNLDLSCIKGSSLSTQFELTILRQGLNIINVEVLLDKVFKARLETAVECLSIDGDNFFPAKTIIRSYPNSSPESLLKIRTLWNKAHSACSFLFQLQKDWPPSKTSDSKTFQSEELSCEWFEYLQDKLQLILERSHVTQVEHSINLLMAFGLSLFKKVFPTELQNEFHRPLRLDRSLSVLILYDSEVWMPWEIFHDGQIFLNESFSIGRWHWELVDSHTCEIPVGPINLVHYAGAKQLEQWQSLLQPNNAPPATLASSDDIYHAFDDLRALHILRYGQSNESFERQEAPILIGENSQQDDNVGQQLRPAKLELRFNRPLVCLSYIHNGYSELTNFESIWVPAFLRSGASAFIGSHWAVDSAVESTFISNFYNRLWLGDPLGKAFQIARQHVRITHPDSIDWLSYCLFGNPMAQPYRPVAGKGYAIVEPIGQEIEDPLSTGDPLRFRLSLRRTPPIWHEERVIEVAEDLTFEDLQVHVATFGLEVTPPTVTMSRTPNGNYLGWFTLTAPDTMAGKSSLVQVYFSDGMEPIHSVTFSLQIAPTEVTA